MTLPQNVKDAVKFANAECGKSSDFTFNMSGADWQTIHAHLLSQEAEIERLQSGLAAANKRLEAAERDAARYRWLRGGDSRLAVCDEDTSYYLEQLDAAIDAALQEHTP
jgi:hypothetical protein